VARWNPDAYGRLAEAALALYLEQGYEATTVAEIAQRAGVTERTFFRHFPDKREVLFAGSPSFVESIVTAAAAAPANASALEVVGLAFVPVATHLEGIRDFARRRHAVIGATPELYERDLAKLDQVATRLTDELRRRGADEARARVTAAAGVAAFSAAFAMWCDATDETPLVERVRACVGVLASDG
jgi:AcrR family transcriptional regulator